MLETEIPTWTEQWMQEGRREGHRAGHREGLKEGEGRFLRRLAEKKFGALSDSILEKIAGADEDRLMSWGTRLLTAKRVEDVFDGN